MTTWAPEDPSFLPKKPAEKEPIKGKNKISKYILTMNTKLLWNVSFYCSVFTVGTGRILEFFVLFLWVPLTVEPSILFISDTAPVSL